MGASAAASAGSGGIGGRTAARGLRFWEGRTEDRPRRGDLGLQRRPPTGTLAHREPGRGEGRKGAGWLAARVQCLALPLNLAGRRLWADVGPSGTRCESSELCCVHQTCAMVTLSVHCHTRGRVERASTASLRSVVCALGTLEEGEKTEKLLCAARFCAHDLYKSTSRAPASPPCVSVKL